jgi:hypothetical protein
MHSMTKDPELLTCWKDIAEYMGKGVRTVQRWEQTLDLPVRRPRGKAYKSTVLARPKDLDVWLASRWSSRSQRDAENDTVTPPQTNLGFGSLVRASRELRRTNHLLTIEVGIALATLIRNCEEMAGLSTGSKAGTIN